MVKMQILEGRGGRDDDYNIPKARGDGSGGRHRRVSSYCGCGGGASVSFGLRRSLSYDILPQLPIKLTICKLDSSSFEIEVAKMASIEEVKQAVEEVFTYKHRKDHCNISWAHVWGHFCLCYDGWRLLDDSECIQAYMINDGDQLHFVRHVSVNTSSFRKQPKDKWLTLEESKMSSCKPNCFLETHRNNEKEEVYYNHGSSPCRYGEDENMDTTCEFKFAQILERWFSYRRLGRSANRTKSRDLSAKVADTVSGGFKSITRFCSSNKLSSRRDTFEEV